MSKPRVIAFYLPQFHPCKENDEWWGKGFTEWTNVGKAKPLFKKHNQPRIPSELGYYDLRLPIVREQQAQLARSAGVTAFCYWHYWFGNGKRLLGEIFDEVLDSGRPDFPFCLGWANHSWYAKSWNKDIKDRLLVKQNYFGINDAKQHFSFLRKAFYDKRYFKVEGKPFFLIFDPITLPKEYIVWFRMWAKDAGFPDLYIVANSYDIKRPVEEYIEMGYDAVTYGRISSLWGKEYASKRMVGKMYSRVWRVMKQMITGIPRGARDYAKEYHNFVTDCESKNSVIPQIVPQWDHSPRSGNKAEAIFYNSKPEYFYRHVKEAIAKLKDKPEALQLLLLKSWNEWGEGNYMEPDLTNGRGYINVLHKAIEESK